MPNQRPFAPSAPSEEAPDPGAGGWISLRLRARHLTEFRAPTCRTSIERVNASDAKSMSGEQFLAQTES